MTTATARIIHVAIELEPEFLQEVLTTAVQGSITYWAESKLYGTEVYELTSAMDPADFEPCAFSVGSIAMGIRRALERNNCAKHIWTQISNAVHYQDAGYIDADCADVIVQLAVFEEIVYG